MRHEEECTGMSTVHQDEDLTHRIVVVMAGYNKRKNPIQKIREFFSHKIVKSFYNEDLIDSKNKAAIVLDEQNGTQTIEYVLDAIEKVPNTHTIIVGDKKSLEAIVSKKERRSVETIVEQGNCFADNLALGKKMWNERYKEIISQSESITEYLKTMNVSTEAIKISPHVFYVFGDTFLAEGKILLDAFRLIEQLDADVSFTYCKKNTDDPRGFFTYRPWAHLKDSEFRNANLGALRISTESDQRIRGIPKEKEYLAQIGYNVRKLFNPINIIRVFRELGENRSIVSKYFKGELHLNEIEHTISRMLSTERQAASFAFVPVDLRLEADIDSEKDILRAKKMIYLRNETYVTLHDCMDSYEACKRSNIKEIEIIGRNTKTIKLEQVTFELEKCHNDCKNVYSDIAGENIPRERWYKSLYYDLKRAIELHKN